MVRTGPSKFKYKYIQVRHVKKVYWTVPCVKEKSTELRQRSKRINEKLSGKVKIVQD